MYYVRQKKADILIKHYAGVSKIDMSKENRTENSLAEEDVKNMRSKEFD